MRTNGLLDAELVAPGPMNLETFQPQRHPIRLHGVLNHADEVVGKVLEIHLITQANRELLNRPGRVVPVPVEAAVNEPLNAGSSGPKESGHSQCGSRYRNT